MKIYISGPITGIEDYKEKFETAEKEQENEWVKTRKSKETV